MIHLFFYAGTLVKNEALLRLQNLLSPIEPSWDIFAQQIGVPNIVVTRIQTTHARTSPNWLATCFKEALEWWVANHRNPTYEVIIAVLDPKEGETNPAMNRALARKVRRFMAGEQGEHQPLAVRTQVLVDNTVLASHSPYPLLNSHHDNNSPGVSHQLDTHKVSSH